MKPEKPQSRSGRAEKDKQILPLLVFETRIVKPHCIVSVPTTAIRLRTNHNHKVIYTAGAGIDPSV